MPASRSASPAADLATTVVLAAFIAVLGIFPGIYVGGSGVPIVLQNMGPLIAGAMIGARRGVASVVLLLVLVAIGLPLLSGGRGGLAPFAGPSSGFLFGWILSALVTGLIAQRALGSARPGSRFLILLLAAFAGLVADYVLGIGWLTVYLGDFRAALVGSLVFVPGDLVKVVVTALVATVVHRALPGRFAASPARTR
ncbi:MAG: biotin transporter BioY [Pseudonocardia sp.]|nr:biotin transporter BioY [Pseudonocardia sp.]